MSEGRHLLLFSGFLGSGKTTVIVPLAKAVAASGRRVAVVVNEIGEIGIDNQFMRHLGLSVRELVAGCMCCTLAGDLIKTLEKLDTEYAPDIALIEASGAADPKSVLSALPYYHGKGFSDARVTTLVDPLRLPMLMEIMTPLITSQIRHADVAIISKADMATKEEIEFARTTIGEINPNAPCLVFGKGGASEREELASELLPWPI